MKSYRLLGTIAISTAFGVVVSLVVQHVRAAGAPASIPLTYTGLLEAADGTPVDGPKPIGLSLFDAQTMGKKITGCEVASDPPTQVTRGRFQIALPDACVSAVQANAELWVDVQVEGLSLGRTRLGAVPYAIEAGHSLRADQASRATGSLAGMWSASPTDCASIVSTSAWTDIPGNSITFQVDATARLLGTFSINIQPNAAPGAELVAVRMVLDGNAVPGGVDHYEPYSTADANAALHAISVGDVNPGPHTLKLQWYTSNGLSSNAAGTITWSSCAWSQSNGPIAARTLVAQAFYK